MSVEAVSSPAPVITGASMEAPTSATPFANLTPLTVEAPSSKEIAGSIYQTSTSLQELTILQPETFSLPISERQSSIDEIPPTIKEDTNHTEIQTQLSLEQTTAYAHHIGTYMHLYGQAIHPKTENVSPAKEHSPDMVIASRNPVDSESLPGVAQRLTAWKEQEKAQQPAPVLDELDQPGVKEKLAQLKATPIIDELDRPGATDRLAKLKQTSSLLSQGEQAQIGEHDKKALQQTRAALAELLGNQPETPDTERAGQTQSPLAELHARYDAEGAQGTHTAEEDFYIHHSWKDYIREYDTEGSYTLEEIVKTEKLGASQETVSFLVSRSEPAPSEPEQNNQPQGTDAEADHFKEPFNQEDTSTPETVIFDVASEKEERDGEIDDTPVYYVEDNEANEQRRKMTFAVAHEMRGEDEKPIAGYMLARELHDELSQPEKVKSAIVKDEKDGSYTDFVASLANVHELQTLDDITNSIDNAIEENTAVTVSQIKHNEVSKEEVEKVLRYVKNPRLDLSKELTDSTHPILP